MVAPMMDVISRYPWMLAALINQGKTDVGVDVIVPVLDQEEEEVEGAGVPLDPGPGSVGVSLHPDPGHGIISVDLALEESDQPLEAAADLK